MNSFRFDLSSRSSSSKRRGSNGRLIDAIGVPALFLLVGLVIAGISLFIRADSIRSAEELTASTVATVLPGAEEKRGQDCKTSSGTRTCRTVYKCSVSYTYTPQGGSLITDSALEKGRCGNDHASGAERALYYNPAQPTQTSFVDPNGASNQYSWMVIFGIGSAITLLGMTFAVKNIRKDLAVRGGNSEGSEGA